MAQKVAAATGAWSAAATWNSVTNTPTLHASTNITISTSNLFTATFTAPNTTNACTGVLLFITAVGSGGTVTVTLQESTIDTAAARAIATTALVAGTWVYFRFATPYVFTTTGAGAYRFKIVNAGATGTTSAAADSGAANIAYRATDDRTGVPASTDDVDIPGQNQVTPITVTVDGTQTIGSGTDTVLAVQRTLGNAIGIGNLGVLAWDTTADATLTCKGNIICNNNSGELRMGTVATPMPAARVAKLRFDMAATGNHGMLVFATGKLTMQGTPKSSTSLWKAKLVSGVGTAASPLVVNAAVDWSVGDEIVIGTTDTYDHNEYRFIIAKNSATSYVLSLTAGGVEAALTHTHTSDAWVLNISRNVMIDSTDLTRAYYIRIEATTAGNVDIDWALFDVLGAGIANKTGLFLTNTSATMGLDYSVLSRQIAMLNVSVTQVALTLTGLISVKQSNGSGSLFTVATNAHNKTFVDCFAIAASLAGFNLSNTFNSTFTRCYALGCNSSNNGALGGWVVAVSGFLRFNDCETHANRICGIFLSGVSDATLTGFLSGTKGVNPTDVIPNTSTYNTVFFVSSSFGSATLLSGYLNMLAGSSIQFQAYNGVSTNHIWYTKFGTARSTGAGLVDTTNKTAGNLTVRIAPEDLTTGFTWEFLVGIKASTAASIFGFAQKNVAFGSSVCMVELFLPGSTVADATVTLDNTTGAWQVFNLAANYTGLVASFATIRITAKTATAAAYVYFTDFYNGTNVLTGLEAWYQGKPTPVMTDLLGDPASVWAILESTQTTPGTMGYEISTDLATLRSDVDDLQTRVPATLTVNGNMKADTLRIEGIDATDQIRDAILTDATRFAGADIATIKGYIDTEIAAILAAVDTEVAAIKAKTDNLPADPADESNTQTAITSVLAAIATLNNPSTAAIVTAIFAGTMEGRAFEEILKDIWAQVVGDFVADDADEPTSIVYEGPNGATQLTHTITDTTRSWS